MEEGSRPAVLSPGGVRLHLSQADCRADLPIERDSFSEGDVPNESLKKLYVDELKDLFSAENQLLKALPKMAKAVSS